MEDHVVPPAGVELRPLSRLSGMGPSAALIDLARWAARRWVGPVSGFLATAAPSTVVEAAAAGPAWNPEGNDAVFAAAALPFPVTALAGAAEADDLPEVERERRGIDRAALGGLGGAVAGASGGPAPAPGR